MKPSTQARGVYFLANNKVYELAVAFLNSFRTHNPDIDLCLIPYDDEFDRILALRETYRFSVFSDQSLLDCCDAISVRFHDRTVGAYRKLVTWEGVYDEFMYIDIDTVVLTSIDFAYANLRHCDFFTSHSNIDGIRKWVWKDSIFGRNILSPQQIAFAANMGFFVSRRQLLPMRDIVAKVDAALELKNDMELMCLEQPFLNYLIVTSNLRYTSLLLLRMSGLAPDAKLEMWAGNPGGVTVGGKFSVENYPEIFLLHWAGIWQSDNGSLSDLPYKEIWSHYRHLNICISTDKPLL